MDESERKLDQLISEAVQRADLFSSHLSDKIDFASLTLHSKLPMKALTIREILLHRFSDQCSCASRAMESGHPVSAATLTRGAMESFARLFESYNFLCNFFAQPDLKKLDEFLMNRLFGAKNREADWPVAVNIMTAIDKMEKLVPHYRENYDRLSEIAHPNYLGGVGIFQKIDRENHIIFLGDPDRKRRALNTVVYALVGTQDGFEKVYNEMEFPVRKLNELFESGDLRHEATEDKNPG